MTTDHTQIREHASGKIWSFNMSRFAYFGVFFFGSIFFILGPSSGCTRLRYAHARCTGLHIFSTSNFFEGIIYAGDILQVTADLSTVEISVEIRRYLYISQNSPDSIIFRKQQFQHLIVLYRKSMIIKIFEHRLSEKNTR